MSCISFDNYERGIADLFVGELGIDGKYPYNLLASGAVRMSLERNGDLNPLLAERPVMRHWDFSEHRQLHSMLIKIGRASCRERVLRLV